MTQTTEPKFNNRKLMIQEVREAGKPVDNNIPEYLLVHFFCVYCIPNKWENKKP